MKDQRNTDLVVAIISKTDYQRIESIGQGRKKYPKQFNAVIVARFNKHEAVMQDKY